MIAKTLTWPKQAHYKLTEMRGPYTVAVFKVCKEGSLIEDMKKRFPYKVEKMGIFPDVHNFAVTFLNGVANFHLAELSLDDISDIEMYDVALLYCYKEDLDYSLLSKTAKALQAHPCCPKMVMVDIQSGVIIGNISEPTFNFKQYVRLSFKSNQSLHCMFEALVR